MIWIKTVVPMGITVGLIALVSGCATPGEDRLVLPQSLQRLAVTSAPTETPIVRDEDPEPSSPEDGVVRASASEPLMQIPTTTLTLEETLRYALVQNP